MSRSEDGGAPIAILIRTAPTTRALARILAVLHRRNAQVLELNWNLNDSPELAGQIRLLVTVPAQRRAHLQSVLERIVEVISLEVIEPGISQPDESALC